MIRKGLGVELRWFTLVVIAALIVGFAVGYVFFVLSLALLGYIAWILRNLARLERWVVSAREKSIKPNRLQGVFGEIVEDIVLLSKRYRKDKKRLQAVVIRVQDMATALADGVVLLDKGGNIEWWNQAAEDLFNFQEVDRGHKITNIIRHPSFVKYFEKGTYKKSLSLKGLRRAEQHIQFNIHPFGRGERLITLTDITRMVKLEHMRRDFVANVSHEMRTPLTVIRGYIETLGESDNTVPPVWAKAMGAMHVQCERMTALVNDLITLSQLETAETEAKQKPVEVLPLIQSILADAKAISSDTKHQFECRCDKPITLKGNKKELHSAFANLILNAVKYSPENCLITVEIQQSDFDVVVRIKDNGPGIDAKHLPRLTERFYRVEDSRNSRTGGTGLGLAIVKHVLLRHDGELKISSKVGTGSTFSCHFALSRLVEVVTNTEPSLESILPEVF